MSTRRSTKGNFLTSFIFSPFSERDVILLVFLCCVYFIDQRSIILPLLLELVNNATVNRGDALKTGIVYLFVLGYFFYALFLICKHAITSHQLKPGEKRVLSLLFYVLISAVSLFALKDVLFTSGNPLIIAIIIYMLARSLLTLFSTFILFRTGKHDVYARQMNDEQISKTELIALLLIAPIIYVLTRMRQAPVVTLSLSYFYMTYILIFTRSARMLFR